MLGAMTRESRTGANIAVGGIFDLEALALATSSTVLGFPVLIHYSGFLPISNRDLYPLTCRMVPPSISQIDVLFDVLDHFYGITKQIQWRQPGTVAGANPYGISMGSSFVRRAEERNFYITTYQQFLATTNSNQNINVRDITQQLNELKNSKSRVFVALLQTIDMQFFITQAQKVGLFNRNYVWLCSDACAQNFIRFNITAYPEQTLIVPEYVRGAQGLIGVSIPIDPPSPEYRFLVDIYLKNFNLTVPIGSDLWSLYDGFVAASRALDSVSRQNLTFNATNIVAALRNVSFAGATGWIEFDSKCERKPVYDIVNVWRGLKCPECLGLHPLDVMVPVGRWNYSSGLEMYRPVRFFDGTTTIPDLNLHRSFDYFDCDEGRKKTDETGFVVFLFL